MCAGVSFPRRFIVATLGAEKAAGEERNPATWKNGLRQEWGGRLVVLKPDLLPSESLGLVEDSKQLVQAYILYLRVLSIKPQFCRTVMPRRQFEPSEDSTGIRAILR